MTWSGNHSFSGMTAAGLPVKGPEAKASTWKKGKAVVMGLAP